MQESYAIREWCFDEVLKSRTGETVRFEDIIKDAKKLEQYIRNGELKEQD